ncbi:alpha- and gamma-adaptin-binding protein p34-like [Anopheles nili]|uniref:alpha- and gamma-adaptin-binding protein p34-like n=1 Tax=Anopheles nili TaxID=185578 RepID=UPI00237B8585|nr:alpha- and gamma-adaptin-binding protein p34-like [Anopheles nili]
MTEPIVLIMSADETVKPESVIELIRKATNEQDAIVLSSDAPESIGYPYVISNKYYTKTLILYAHGSADLATVSSAILNRTEALFVYFNAKDRTFLERIPLYADFAQSRPIELAVLLCSSLPESSTDGITYSEAKHYNALLDVIELEPARENDEEEDDDGQAVGVEELIQTMHNFVWSDMNVNEEPERSPTPPPQDLVSSLLSANRDDPNGPFTEEEERIIESELRGFQRILTEVINFQPNTSNWTRNQRLTFAEEVAEMFDNLVEEDDMGPYGVSRFEGEPPRFDGLHRFGGDPNRFDDEQL